jgi:hypothetical protein
MQIDRSVVQRNKGITGDKVYRFEELDVVLLGERAALLGANHALVRHVAFVADQDLQGISARSGRVNYLVDIGIGMLVNVADPVNNV